MAPFALSSMPSVPNPTRIPPGLSSRLIRLALGSVVVLAVPAVAAHGAGRKDPVPASTAYSFVPAQSSDRFVNGKYDKTGIYVPPHYQAAPKPAFHGYFFKKPTANKNQPPN